jgi:hypothetical protein
MKKLFLLIVTGCGQVAPTSDAAIPDSGSDVKTDVIIQDAASDVSDALVEGDASPDAGACTYLLSSYPCNSLPEGTLITVGCTSQPPTPQGGTLVDGVYDLVQTDWDTTATDAACPSGLTRRGTIEGNVSPDPVVIAA